MIKLTLKSNKQLSKYVSTPNYKDENIFEKIIIKSAQTVSGNNVSEYTCKLHIIESTNSTETILDVVFDKNYTCEIPISSSLTVNVATLAMYLEFVKGTEKAVTNSVEVLINDNLGEISSGGGGGGTGGTTNYNDLTNKPQINGISLAGNKTSDSLKIYQVVSGAIETDGHLILTMSNGTTKDCGEVAKLGADGKSAYQIAMDNGYVGTEQQWLVSLKGADGINGTNGQDGARGADGKDGINGVKGDKGDKGDNGNDYILTDTDKSDIADLAKVKVESEITIPTKLSELENDESYVTNEYSYSKSESNNKFAQKTEIPDISKLATKTEVQTVSDNLDNKENKTAILISTDSTISLELIHNTDYRYGVLTSGNLSIPTSLQDNYMTSFVFASGDTATSLTYSDTIKWSGDDITDGAFVPTANKVYNVILWNDGTYVNAVVRGV